MISWEEFKNMEYEKQQKFWKQQELNRTELE